MIKNIFKSPRALRVFIINLSVVLTVLIVATYTGIYMRDKDLVIKDMKDQADSYFALILNAREWVAGYGGVYVEKKPGVESNAFVEDLGVQSDVSAVDGRVFTLRNPAMMTRELSELTREQTGVRFHITSLKLINQSNVPDDFEYWALKRFDEGETEATTIDRSGPLTYIRFMRPLKVQAPCLNCHQAENYEVGDIRGGISISIPFDRKEQQLRATAIIITALSGLTIAIVLGTLFFMAGQLAKEIESSQKKLLDISVTDDLTGIKNRRYIMGRLTGEFGKAMRTGSPLGLLMLDLDHFKVINDTHGHHIGDAVLKETAERIRDNIRAYDEAGRFGGEEFIVMSPDTKPADLDALAERLRETMKALPVAVNGKSVTVTVSIGATVALPSDDGPDDMLARADKALYSAKENGRDRVESVYA